MPLHPDKPKCFSNILTAFSPKFSHKFAHNEIISENVIRRNLLISKLYHLNFFNFEIWLLMSHHCSLVSFIIDIVAMDILHFLNFTLIKSRKNTSAQLWILKIFDIPQVWDKNLTERNVARKSASEPIFFTSTFSISYCASL